uniref:ATP-binding protein n=1 Tax=Fervidobacterium pennivorans TaxID=93466 RepID=A0A7C4RYS4_FERPE
MNEQRTNIEQLISTSERIGTIGSPSSTSELSLDILGTAVSKKLVGELALFKFSQDSKPHYALGQITEIQLRNIWLEDPTMRSLARQRGQVNPVSGQQDTHLDQMTISAVFSDESNRFEPSILGTVPATGTPIYLATDQILDKLLERYRDEIFYLGHVYGSTPKLPLWFKHFGTGPHGAGEAYHIGIFGKTGSGKSVLAKMILLAYARYPEMAIFVIDPQGEFSKDINEQIPMEGFPLDLRNILNRLNKNVVSISVRNLVLDRWDLFEHILAQSEFFERLAIHTMDKRKLAAEVLREDLERRQIRLSDLHTQRAFQTAWSILQEERVLKQIYSGAEYRNRLLDMINQTDPNHHYQTYWLPVCKLFQSDRENAVTVDVLLKKAFTQQQTKPVIVVNVSREEARDLYWNDIIQALVIKRLLDGINLQAELNYQRNRSLNTLVIIDEAHRFAPREKPEQEELRQVGETLVRASKETRKYGLGWMFISQTLSSLHRDIITQLRIFFFGFGLALGTEFTSLKEIVGGDPNALKLYQSFRDPHSAFDIASRQYAFMTIGPVSPLSFAGTPLFFTAFNTPEQFLRENRLLSG